MITIPSILSPLRNYTFIILSVSFASCNTDNKTGNSNNTATESTSVPGNEFNTDNLRTITTTVINKNIRSIFQDKKGNYWFGTNGDVFPVGVKMTPFPPRSPDGSRSYPRRHLANGHGQWNQYYIRAINGEVRLWVNGDEVSGGTGCDPAEGFLCLESEASPIQFRKLRIRELP